MNLRVCISVPRSEMVMRAGKASDLLGPSIRRVARVAARAEGCTTAAGLEALAHRPHSEGAAAERRPIVRVWHSLCTLEWLCSCQPHCRCSLCAVRTHHCRNTWSVAQSKAYAVNCLHDRIITNVQGCSKHIGVHHGAAEARGFASGRPTPGDAGAALFGATAAPQWAAHSWSAGRVQAGWCCRGMSCCTMA